MLRRILSLPKQSSFFVFGARGTGKSTLLRGCYSEKVAVFIDLLDAETEDLYARNPAGLHALARGLGANVRWIIIDEIQKAPKLLDVVHQLIETTQIKFILTGSSSRKLKRGVSNLLAGRAFVHTLFPFTSVELASSFDLTEALKWGTLPRIHAFDRDEDKAAYLRAYALTYLKEEIQAEQIVRKLDPFRLFLEIAAQTNGRIINYTKIADDVGVDAKTVMTYFAILEETLIGVTLPAFHRSVRKQQRTNPKFYLFDTGVKRALDRTLMVDLQEQTYAYGDAFEHFIVIELIRLCAYHFPDFRFFYLQSSAGAEIDLIIDRPGQGEALIEIKSTTQVTGRDVEALQRFLPAFPGAQAFCISRDHTRKKIGEVLCLHWKEALIELHLDGKPGSLLG
jgi:predicted AAA+ superfamily ATPase